MSHSALTFAVFRGQQPAAYRTVDEQIVKLGSDPKSHVQLDDPRAGRMHAVIERRNGSVTLIDLGNESGTFVNGQRVDKCVLAAGDRIRIGDTELVLQSSEAPLVGAAAAPAFVASENPFTSSAFAFDQTLINPFASSAHAVSSATAVPDDAPPGTYTYSIIKSAPDVPSDEVELSHTSAIEVTVIWGDSVLHVAHVAPERGFSVGEEQNRGSGCDFFLPEEKLGTTRLPLLIGGRLVLPAGASGWVELPGQARLSIEQAKSLGEPLVELAGAHALALSRGARARIELGGFAFVIAAVAAGKPTKKGVAASFDSSIAGFFGATLLASASLIAAMAMFVPPLGLTEDSDGDREMTALIQQYLETSAEREQLEQDQPAEEQGGGEEGSSGQRAAGEEGKMGNPVAKTEGGRWKIKGPPDNPDPHVAMTRDEAASFGLIGLLAGGAANPSAVTAPFGRDTSLGMDDSDVMGTMWGDDLGEGRGTGGLGLSGIGQGGGCQVGSCVGIGLGSIGTYNHGAGLGDDQGFGNNHGRLGKGYKTKGAPRVRPGSTTVSGRLPAEVIQRIVRQNYGRFRMCYEQGLGRNPNLEGRVAARFVIGRDGAVSNVANGGSDLPDSGTVGCVISAFYGLTFPQPEDGIVTVVYPIMFQPG